MKFNRLLSLGLTASLVALLLVLGVATSNANSRLPKVERDRETSTSSRDRHSIQQTVITSSTVTQLSGNFVGASAPTTGIARIVEENGQKYLKINSAFSTSRIPNLQVLLDTVAQPPVNYQQGESNRYLNLGSLQSEMGEQSYPIPEFVDVSNFQSVVIWCSTANATMGYASLSANSSASIE